MTNTEHQHNKLPIEILAPWANIIVKSKIPDEVFEDLLTMYHKIMNSKWDSHGQSLVGQIDEEVTVKIEEQKKHSKWISFCVTMIQKFLVAQQNTNQVSQTTDYRMIDTKKFTANISAMWFVNQKPSEYNPAHVHTNCSISSIAYLKTPKNKIKSKKEFYETDGKISFINNAGADSRWSVPILNLEPKEQDIYIFPALQTHMVYPYKSSNPEDRRVSVSFNADIKKE
tara:strand:+ start:751 stop:1431 length:681 start_codon:yes stop_codon:yes gene_type:complete